MKRYFNILVAIMILAGCFHRQRASANCAVTKKWSRISRSRSMWATRICPRASTRSQCLTRLQIERSFKYEAPTVDRAR